ncbi:MAG: 23S rRNA (pseudouridine(1915)-N(3))-methyltransferase RlmH [Chitinophagales bacterium]|nr:23S rRNA (pseudouridine(1915)-N(3))-methyltransferase RlmH [Chitinophagales bacterium]MDW8393401.1 23S rRNA (pseudouridine(1915)-N(3))-methyltransferase RlmH [Chitinophagales bacterium]
MGLRMVLFHAGKDAEAEALYRRYEQRLQNYIRVETFLQEKGRRDEPAAWQKPPVTLVALDATGLAMTSEGLSSWLEKRLQEGRHLVFLIGGANGLEPELMKKAHWKLSLSPMTLPHHLARVVLAEQLYRAFTILNRHPYHLGH